MDGAEHPLGRNVEDGDLPGVGVGVQFVDLSPSARAAIEKELENISNLRDVCDARTFKKAVRLLGAASEVVVVGTRSTASLASHLWFGLNKLAIKATRVLSITTETYDDLNARGKRTCVIVTGCYDWFHSGHVRFFEEVSAYGDLYVIVGHDANIRLLKGDGHPLFSQVMLAFVMLALLLLVCSNIAFEVNPFWWQV